MGVMFYLGISCLIFSMVTLCVVLRDDRRRRMDIIEKLEASPFGSLAFDVEMTCAVCLEDFAAQDEVLVLGCNNKHIFHRLCMSQWAKESTHSEA